MMPVATTFFFYFLSAVTVVSGAGVILRKNPVHSALALIVALLGQAGLYLMLYAPFVAGVQIILYAGGIMVLFLFVIMLLDLAHPGPTDIKGPVGLAVGVLLAVGLFFQLGVLRAAGPPAAIALPPETLARAAAEQGMVGSVARPLFDAYLVPFEITSLLLLAALVGAVVLAKRRL
jgi:NADH-quinone oxidoreductase subunit J